MKTVWIDPSYFGTGICIVDDDSKEISFNLISRPETKRGLPEYWLAAKTMANELWAVLCNISDDSIIIYMEAPIPMGNSAPGLWGLQFMYLNVIEHASNTKDIYSITPAWISRATKKYLHVDNHRLSDFKPAVEKLVVELETAGWKIKNRELLKHSGADVHTAFLFWYLTSAYRKEEWLKLR